MEYHLLLRDRFDSGKHNREFENGKRKDITVRRLVISLAVLVAFPLVFASSADATITTFIGSDIGASGPGAGSHAARTAFDLAAALLGPTSTIDFESAPLGPFASLPVAPGVTASGTATKIRTGTFCSLPLCGGNTTPSGSQFMELLGGSATFTFGPGVQGFGAYFGGLQSSSTTFVGTETLTFADSTTHTISFPDFPFTAGGFAFIGFTTDEGPLVTSVKFSAPRDCDIVSIDDVRVVSGSSVVPEPTSLLLVSAGLGLLGLVRRKQN